MPWQVNRLTRTFYYSGELLVETDFIRDQQFARDLVGYQNHYMFEPGVVSGMELTFDPGDPVYFEVTAGMAIDANGDMLLLATPIAFPSGSDTIDHVLKNGTYFVAIQYSNSLILTDPNELAQERDRLMMSHDIEEKPVLLKPSEKLPSGPDSNVIVLGKITISGGVITVTNILPGSGRMLCKLKPDLVPPPPSSSTSDARLKVDIRPLDGALDRVAALRPVSFAWRSDRAGERHLGLIAQEVAEVVPEVVGKNSEGYGTLSYQELVPLLIQSTRELTARVADLERQLALLKKERAG